MKELEKLSRDQINRGSSWGELERLMTIHPKVDEIFQAESAKTYIQKDFSME